MATSTTGLVRTLGPLVQSRVQELRRTAAVAVSDAVEEATAAGSYSRRVSVLRREVTVAATPSLGLAGTWTTVAGLADLVGHVRTAGNWKDKAEPNNVTLKEADRSVILADLPDGGAGDQYRLLSTDRLQWDDPVYGADAVFDVVEVQNRLADGLCVALCRYARET